MSTAYIPTLDRAVAAERLAHILHPGSLTDTFLESHIRRLSEQFAAWVATYHLGIWSPGLIVTSEMRLISETYLPMESIRSAIRYLYRVSFVEAPALHACPIHRSSSWLDLLPDLFPYADGCSPALFLRRLASDGLLRQHYLFSSFLPPRYGCRFGRYPRQLEFIRNWLAENQPRSESVFRCLDAASGTGEGAYDLARLLLESGYPPHRFCVHGTTIDAMELFAGAHGVFPHDQAREEAFRSQIDSLEGSGATARMAFFQGDVLESVGDGGQYALIVCNGLIGGPMMNHPTEIARVLRALSRSLVPGGLLCITDRFHDGWKDKTSNATLHGFFLQCGLEVMPIFDGIAGVRAL